MLKICIKTDADGPVPFWTSQALAASLTVTRAFVGVESISGRTGADETTVQIGTVVLTCAGDVTLVDICYSRRTERR